MALRDRLLTSGRLGVIASILFGLFVLFDLALFGLLIFKTLSQREIEKVLLETREEAESLAGKLAAQAAELGQDDLFVVMSVAEETRTYIDSVLESKDVVRSIEIRDKNGTVVYEESHHESESVGDDVPRVEVERHPELEGVGSLETEALIGDLGSLVIGLSEEEMSKRIAVLRRDLVRQASLIGALSAVLLAFATAAVLVFGRRAERLERQAREAERLAYVGQLAAGLAHEIRNPLNSLNLNMQMLAEEADAAGHGQGSRRLVEITRSEIGRLEGLVTDFLAYARPRPLELETTTAAALFQGVREVLGAELAARRVELQAADDTGGVPVRVDPDQVKQLLINLTQNALAATAEVKRPGRIELRARLVPGPRPPGWVALEVSDNGCGIVQEDQPKIFDLFFSTRKGGTGLGLAIVERIAHSHGAEVEVESIPGEGSTVRVLLPRPDGETQSPP